MAPPTSILGPFPGVLQCDNGPVGPRKLQTMVSLATGSLATSLSSTSPGKTMPLCWLSLLFLAWLSASRAQLKRQRVGELEPAPAGMQESACSFGGGTRGDGGPTQEPFVLLPWALLLALSGSFVIYLLFAKEQEVSSSPPPSFLPHTIRKSPPPNLLFCTPASPLWTCIRLGSTRGLGTASVPPAKRDCPVLLSGFYPRPSDFSRRQDVLREGLILGPLPPSPIYGVPRGVQMAALLWPILRSDRLGRADTGPARFPQSSASDAFCEDHPSISPEDPPDQDALPTSHSPSLPPP